MGSSIEKLYGIDIYPDRRVAKRHLIPDLKRYAWRAHPDTINRIVTKTRNDSFSLRVVNYYHSPRPDYLYKLNLQAV